MLEQKSFAQRQERAREDSSVVKVLPVPVQHSQSFQFVEYISFQAVQHKFVFDHLAPIYTFFIC